MDIVIGNWDGIIGDEIGKYINVDPGDFFLLDLNGNFQWNNTGGGDAIAVVANGADAGTPLIGDWNGDGVDTVWWIRSWIHASRNSVQSARRSSSDASIRRNSKVRVGLSLTRRSISASAIKPFRTTFGS